MFFYLILFLRDHSMIGNGGTYFLLLHHLFNWSFISFVISLGVTSKYKVKKFYLFCILAKIYHLQFKHFIFKEILFIMHIMVLHGTGEKLTNVNW